MNETNDGKIKDSLHWACAAYDAAKMIPVDTAVPAIERMFKEYARDQRHLCAESVAYDDEAHSKVMNTPTPWD